MRQGKTELVPSCVRIPRDSVEELDRMAQKFDVSKGWLVRQALTEFLSKPTTDNLLTNTTASR